MPMRDYAQKVRHLVSCIVTSPTEVASQVPVFIFGMREGMTRYCLTRAEPATPEVAFVLALREDYTVASSYTRALTPDTRVSTPVPMEIDFIEAESRSRSTSTPRGPRPITDNHLPDGRQLGHRAAVCRALAPGLASIEVVGDADNTFPAALPKNTRGQAAPFACECVIEQRLLLADVPVTHVLILRNAGVVERELPCLEGGEVSPIKPSCSETSASSSGLRRLRKSPRNRSGHRRLHHRYLTVKPAQHREVLNVVEYEEGSPNRVRTIEVADPPSDVATFTRLSGLSWKHFLRNLKLVRSSKSASSPVPTNRYDVSSSRPKAAEPKPDREERFAAQSWTALQDSNNPVYSLAGEFKDIFPETIPVELPAKWGVLHEIDLVPGSKYCVTRQWSLPRDQVQAIDDFFEGPRKADHVRESTSPHSSPTLCVKKATGGWCIVHAFNKLNDAIIPEQTPIPRKDMVLDTMCGSVIFSAIDPIDGFYPIFMRESDTLLMAVSTPSGIIWKWLVMPQGLKNALATFNRMVSHEKACFTDRSRESTDARTKYRRVRLNMASAVTSDFVYCQISILREPRQYLTAAMRAHAAFWEFVEENGNPWSKEFAASSSSDVVKASHSLKENTGRKLRRNA
ncbi:unnamed protein product [Phytophthora fragariaefolia]|uniref:Unnamed protein product n=1 Tax=Phytophthora fragariaefolia TaxID=1490495 RepID=A0A9W6TQY0_9STRA|nr:unnamed protein product [Phytophthora fragariaefolia]